MGSTKYEPRQKEFPFLFAKLCTYLDRASSYLAVLPSKQNQKQKSNASITFYFTHTAAYIPSSSSELPHFVTSHQRSSTSHL